MSIKKLESVNTLAITEMDDWGKAPVPIDSEPSSLAGVAFDNADDSTVGVWCSSPGKWQRQIKDKEMCYFLEGECSYTDEEGNTTQIHAGDLLYFEANSLGVWNIKTPCRKVFITIPQ